MKKRLMLVAALLFLLAFSMGVVYAQVGGSYDLSWATVDGGGGTFSTGGSYSLGGTIGQADAGSMAGGVYTLDGGFWGGAGAPTPNATPTAVATTTSTGTPTETPTSTGTPTSTPTNTPTAGAGLLVGHVTWQGPPAQPNARQQLPITLTLRLAGGGPDNEFPAQNTDAGGYFTVTVTSLANGTYLWRAKGPIYLATSGNVVLSGAPVTGQEMGTMRAGDCNNSNTVNATDFNILKNTFGKSIGQPGYDARADFNNDNAVSSIDFNLLKGTFGQGGAPPVSPGREKTGP